MQIESSAYIFRACRTSKYANAKEKLHAFVPTSEGMVSFNYINKIRAMLTDIQASFQNDVFRGRKFDDEIDSVLVHWLGDFNIV